MVYFLRQIYGGGTLCDLNGKSRTTVVDYFCAQEEIIVSLRETAICSYHVVVHTPRLCTDIAFVRHQSSLSPKIRCFLDSAYESLGSVDGID